MLLTLVGGVVKFATATSSMRACEARCKFVSKVTVVQDCVTFVKFACSAATFVPVMLTFLRKKNAIYILRKHPSLASTLGYGEYMYRSTVKIWGGVIYA